MVGLKPGVDREKFARAIQDGTVEECLRHLELLAGDAIFVPAGTAHTIGPGFVLCEIQEHSDLTYRVYDYNRRDRKGQVRPLHIEKALETIQFGEQKGGKIEPVRIERNSMATTYFAACRYFVTEKWEFDRSLSRRVHPELFELLIFLAGSGEIHWDGGTVKYGPAQVWLLPAALGTYELRPGSDSQVLRTYVPVDMDAWGRELEHQGVGKKDWSRLVHL
jgi:mannose-6-phosphate isomerase